MAMTLRATAVALALGATTFAVTPLAGPKAASAAEPRSSEAVALQVALERACLPLLRGRELEDIARAARLQDDDGLWIIPVEGRKRIELTPPTSVNPTVCAMRITYQAGEVEPLLELLDRWSLSKGLELQKHRQESRGPSLQRKASSWSGRLPDGAVAIVMSEEKTLAGAPVAGAYDQATVLVSLSPT